MSSSSSRPCRQSDWLPAIFLVFFLFLGFSEAKAQPAQAGENILIRNVTLVDATGETEDRLVNILVRGGELEVVTEDKIAKSEADLVVNATSIGLFPDVEEKLLRL